MARISALVKPCPKCGANYVIECHACETAEKYLNLPDMREVYRYYHKSDDPMIKAVDAIKNPKPKEREYTGGGGGGLYSPTGRWIVQKFPIPPSDANVFGVKDMQHIMKLLQIDTTGKNYDRLIKYKQIGSPNIYAQLDPG